MVAPIYILGFLIRYGPLHGYRLKQLISEKVSDFAKIKTPTIYYHLEKMEKKGFIKSESEQEGKRPARLVYTITDTGRQELVRMLEEALPIRYLASFAIDAVFYFSNSMNTDEIIKTLKKNETDLNDFIENSKIFNENLLKTLPDDMKAASQIIYNHHLLHYKAELTWIRNTLKELTS